MTMSMTSDVETDSPVAWPAVIAGAVAALALSFTLLALAAGFGFALASPWPGGSSSDNDFTPLLGAALIVVQVLSCALGGYLAGRLRTRWSSAHSHEVHFRDTAHGLLVWAVCTVVGILLATSVMAPPVTEAAGQAAGQAAATAVAQGPDAAIPPSPQAALSPADQAKLAAQAERAKNVAAQISLFMGVGLLLSAFVASVAAAIGGMRRDDMHEAHHADRVRVGAV